MNFYDGTNQNIDCCNLEKDLGITFDPNLSFDPHIQKSINKANSTIGLIKRTFTHIDKEVFLQLYKALVRPHLEYGNIIWYPYLKRQSVAIEKVQRRATKLVKGCREMKYYERLSYLKLHSLKGRRLRGDLIETFKIFTGKLDLEWDSFFSSPTLNSTRNTNGKIFINRSNTNQRKHFYSNRVASTWNNLPLNTKHAQTTNHFKNYIDMCPKLKEKFIEYD